MPSNCPAPLTHTKYIRIQDAIINGLCGSFSAFPDVSARNQLFQNPTGSGGCSTDFFRGIFFGGADGTVFVPEFLSVPVFISSVTPTTTNASNDLALAFNANDGAAVLFLASLIIETGFVTLQVRKVDEVCEAFSQLPEGGGTFATMAASACGAADVLPVNPNCVCPLFVNITNGQPNNAKFRITNPIAIGNTSSTTAYVSFSDIQDAEQNCFSALDASAVIGGDVLCTSPADCPATKLAGVHGIIQQVNFAIDGMACVTLC